MRRLSCLAGLAVLAFAPALAAADPPPAAAAEPAEQAEHPPSLRDLVTAGEQWRLETPHGPVHVWAPDGYDPRTAAMVVYVHGYYTDIDAAWTEQQLPAQFALSGLNALFVAPEAPSDWNQPVDWTSLRKLVRTVKAGIDERLPRGQLVVVGHSGAHRTVGEWLHDRDLDTLVLLDAVYGHVEQYRDWVRASRKHRLIDVGDDTRPWTDRLHRSLRRTVTLDGFPPAAQGTLPEDVRHARILYIRSSLGHMPLVTDGVALPMLLRALDVPPVAGAPLTLPLGQLPVAPDEHAGSDSAS